MEENQQLIIPEKIKYKFLNYQYYSAFRRDLDSNRILDDAIVFIKDVRRIWARGAEYSCNTQVLVNDGTITILDADGNVVLSEHFAKKSELEELRETVLAINNNLDLVSQGLVAEHNRAIDKEQELDDKISAFKNDSNESLDELRSALNEEITARGNEDSSIREELSTVNLELSDALNEEKNTRESEDSSIRELISTVDLKVDTANTKINAANSEISRIDQRIAAEEVTARSAETTLRNFINSNLIHSADYIPDTKIISFKNINGEEIDTVDCSDFVIDGMISDVKIVSLDDTKYLDIEWNTDGGGRHILLPVEDLIDTDKIQNLIAGDGIDINENIISVKDYIGESSVNAKLKILQQMLAQMYVLKADVYDKDRPQAWSNVPIYSFDDIGTQGDDSSTVAKGNLVVISNGMFNVISNNNEVRTNVCYFITDDETILSGGYEVQENAGIMAIENQVFNSLLQDDLVRNDICYLITMQ